MVGLLATTAVLAWSGCGLVSAPDRDKIPLSSAGGSGGTGMGGAGGAECTSATDCTAATDCLVASCDDGMCISTPDAAGEACSENSGVMCNGTGACVGCIDNDDCATLEVCDDNSCVAGPCANGVQDGMETGVDCGGPDCEAGCALGEVCLDTTDCASLFCDNGMCASCSGSQDCSFVDYCFGGNCIPKELDGTPCSGVGECLNGSCTDGFCCASPCAGTCQSCGTTGMEGSCVNYTQGTDPENECAGPMVCTGGSGCEMP
jgi:hypothetical protein